MMDSPIRILLLSVLVTGAWGLIDMDVCTPMYQSCGPVIPPLPMNFEFKGSRVDNLGKALGYEEVYYDFENLRAKYMILADGMETHYLFDYNASQIIEYVITNPGSSVKQDPLAFECKAKDMRASDKANIFGYRFNPNVMINTLMYDSSHVLRFGGPYQYAFNGNSSDDSVTEDDGRGLKWNSFIGCVYQDDIELTALVRYKFSAYDMLTAATDVLSDIDGSGLIDLLSVPLAVDATGTMLVNGDDGKKAKKPFDESRHFSWFKANPQFDNKNLQIPPWMHCDNYRGWSSMPNFPLAFSARVETTVYSQDMMGKKTTAELLSVQQLYYYNEKGLARRDFTPHKEMDSEILQAFGNGSPVKEVHDFMSLRIYTINMATGRCFSRILDQNGHFSKPDIEIVEMITPEELFVMQQEDMEYKGKYFTRDIECDVWNGKHKSNSMKATSFKESYVTTNGWHSEVDEKMEYRIPIKTSVTTNMEEGEFFRIVVENNFFKFNTYPPVLRFFDITECVETTEHKYYAIKLAVPQGEPQETLNTYRFRFLETAQYYLATVSDLVSPLRIQKIQLSITKMGVILSFAMLEKHGVEKGILNPSKGVFVEDAVKNLRKVIDEGNFQIMFLNPLSKQPIVVTAEPGNLFEMVPVTKITDAKEIKKSAMFDEYLIRERKDVQYDDPATEAPKKKKKTGMSGGALAGLSIGMVLLGVAIGIGVMYLYIRKYGNPNEPNDYVMHTTGS